MQHLGVCVQSHLRVLHELHHMHGVLFPCTLHCLFFASSLAHVMLVIVTLFSQPNGQHH